MEESIAFVTKYNNKYNYYDSVNIKYNKYIYKEY